MKTSKRIWIGLAIMALGISALAMLAHAASEVRGFGGPRGWRMARHLGLTDAQRTEIKSILQTEKSNIRPLVDQLSATRKQLDAASANGFDEAQVRSIANQNSQTLVELMVEHERVKAKIFEVLTPEQRQKAQAIRQHWFDHVQKLLGNSSPAS